MSKKLFFLTLFILPIVVTGCSTGKNTAHQTDSIAMKTITGTVWYRERMMLPPKTEVKVYLEDVSRADVPAKVISETMIKPGRKGPPYDFTLEYDPTAINDKHRYALRARIEADEQLLFINTQSIPAFGEGSQSPAKIMVSRVGGKNKPSQRPDSSLTETYWKLVELNDQPAALGAGQKELSMVLKTEDSRVQGFSGCNRFSGGYELDDDQIKFGPLATTQRACIEGMEQEQQFLKALEKAKRFNIRGENLILYNATENVILRFKAVYLQ